MGVGGLYTGEIVNVKDSVIVSHNETPTPLDTLYHAFFPLITCLHPTEPIPRGQNVCTKRRTLPLSPVSFRTYVMNSNLPPPPAPIPLSLLLSEDKRQTHSLGKPLRNILGARRTQRLTARPAPATSLADDIIASCLLERLSHRLHRQLAMRTSGVAAGPAGLTREDAAMAGRHEAGSGAANGTGFAGAERAGTNGWAGGYDGGADGTGRAIAAGDGGRGGRMGEDRAVGKGLRVCHFRVFGVDDVGERDKGQSTGVRGVDGVVRAVAVALLLRGFGVQCGRRGRAGDGDGDAGRCEAFG